MRRITSMAQVGAMLLDGWLLAIPEDGVVHSYMVRGLERASPWVTAVQSLLRMDVLEAVRRDPGLTFYRLKAGAAHQFSTRVPYPDFCLHPDKCQGRGTCPRNPSCCE